MVRAARCIASALLTATPLCALSQPARSRPSLKIPVAGPVQLQRRPDVLPGNVVAFPRVVPGPAVSADVTKKINASLERDETRVRSAVRECRQSATEALEKDDPDVWQRNVEVTMRGPRFLAFLVTDQAYCGGAYPNWNLTAFVYDLTTGSPVNWNAWLPKGAKGIQATSSDGSTIGLVQWEELRKRSEAQENEDCKGAFARDSEEGSLAYTLVPNAHTNTLDAIPVTVPHAVLACAATVSLDSSAMRKLGVREELLKAIEASAAVRKK